MNFLGLDPGRDKCELAVVDDCRCILFRAVVPAADTLILGNQTAAREWLVRVETYLGGRPVPLQVLRVEGGSTLFLNLDPSPTTT
ncbi:MAG: hypothetical protein IGQ88_11895 [Gloeomargaritaceae cyanobacterium C42_A2020_066]|nr:hypothetical protein [Gloeomargaritaceae cyanobacterium C42_A2020_066]